MTWMALMYVGVGGAIGSMARFLLSSFITQQGWIASFPLGTFTVNVLGGFLMGLWLAVIALLMPAKAKDLHLLFAIGALGGFTTFSTFAVDAYMLLEKQEWLPAILYIGGSVVASLLSLVAGMWLGRLAFG